MSHLNLIYLFFKQHVLLLIVYLFLTLFSYPLEAIVLPQIYSNFFSVLNKNRSKEIFIKYLTILTIFIILVNFTNSAAGYCETYLIPELYTFVSTYLYKNLIIKYENNFQDLELGKIIAKLIFIPNNLKLLLTQLCIVIIPRTFSILLINIYFFYINFNFGLLSLFLLIIILFLNFHYINKCGEISKDRFNKTDMQNEYVQDKLSNLF
jgi:ABC-type multidrug transport system fused ATPase/permease subunit